ncbi:PAS domain S-box protein [Desulfomicrobium baculatum]|uniref:Transcriptional regulator, LuxR family n=1 Tax=Desulfomicrobium baculatum (strain DSM 4028 / VKM B-1378 / X) TaxID=525897 RepID=C7LQR5_DESBD|nr:PAS domain S-box protein [Desulfomicrobium baculatum]ACU89144.1 transcriptional regulator, LuxR family [Desulfomicrobium baculatum DSM 4028]
MRDFEKSRTQFLAELHQTRQKLADHEAGTASLEDTEQRYRALLNTFRVGVAVFDRHGSIIESNGFASTLLGMPGSKRHSRNAHGPKREMIRPDGSSMPPAEFACMLAVEENRLVENVEMGIKNTAGGVTWVSTSALPLRLGDVDLIVVTFCDITERKQAERMLLESEVKFHTLFNSLPMATIICAIEDGKLLEVNDVFEQSMGYSREEALQKSTTDLEIWASPKRRARYASLLKRHGAVRNFETALRRRDGSLAAMLISGELIEIADAKRIISVGLDITDRKRLEKDFNATTARLKDMHVALRVVFEQREQDRLEMERRVLDNMRMLVTPYLAAVRGENLSSQAAHNLDSAVKALEDITSGFARILNDEYRTLTGNEIRVADMVRSGMTSKEIAVALGLSVTTANFYRASIRKKLRLVGKKVTLGAYLMALTDEKTKPR